MKRLIILVIALSLVGSFAFAENTGDITQTGDHNDAEAVQNGDNEATVEQVGDYQTATVDQNGENVGGVYQLYDGSHNTAELSQDGNNEAWITQGVPNWTNYAASDANWNEASVEQMGENYAVLEQYGGTNSSNGNEGEITQNGDGNVAYAYQGWTYYGWGPEPGQPTWALKSYNSDVNISQVNNENSAYVWQYGGNRNDVAVAQDGIGNLASITQGFIYVDHDYSFTHPVYNTQDNNASVTQTGDDNIGKLMQIGDNNSFKLSQTGSGNSVGFDDDDGTQLPDRNEYFYQDGDNNQFAGLNKSGDNISFRANWDAEQHNGALLDAGSEGITGYYGSFQQGDDNVIGLRQGASDEALIQQLGNNNTSTLWQQGSGTNEATMLQNGNNNTASLIQE